MAGGVQGGGGAHDDEEDDDHAGDAAGDDVGASLLVLAGSDALFDEAGLEIEELPGRNGGADESGEREQIAGVELDAGNRHGFGGHQPLGLGQDGGKEIGEVEAAGHQEDFFDLAVSAADDQDPDQRGGKGHGNVFADAEDLHGCGHAGKFGDDVAKVHEEAGDHHEEGGAEAELLADEIGEALAGDHGHARTHLLGDVEGDGHGNERPEQRVAVLGTGQGVGGDAAGIVVHVGGDQAGAQDGQKNGDTPLPVAAALAQVGAARPPGLHTRSNLHPVHHRVWVIPLHRER